MTVTLSILNDKSQLSMIRWGLTVGCESRGLFGGLQQVLVDLLDKPLKFCVIKSIGFNNIVMRQY